MDLPVHWAPRGLLAPWDRQKRVLRLTKGQCENGSDFFFGVMLFTHVQALFQSFFWLGYAWQPRVGNFYGYAWLGVLVRALDMSNLD